MKYWTRDREAGNKIEFFRTKTPQDRYQAEHARRYVVKCFDRTEQDIIDWLEQKPNKAGYIKDLIRADMNREQED